MTLALPDGERKIYSSSSDPADGEDVISTSVSVAPFCCHFDERQRGEILRFLALLEMTGFARSVFSTSPPSDAAGATLERPAARTAEQEILLGLLSAVVRLQAAKHGLNPATLASRKDLEQLLACPEDSNLCRGWRRELIGEELLAFLAGEKRFQIEGGRPCLR